MEKIKGNEKSKELLHYSLFHMVNWEICPSGDQIFPYFLNRFWITHDCKDETRDRDWSPAGTEKETIHFRYKWWDTAGCPLPWCSQKPHRAVASARVWLPAGQEGRVIGAVIPGHWHSHPTGLLSAPQGGWAAHTSLSRLGMEQCGRCSETRQRKGSPSCPSNISVVLLESQSSCLTADPFWDFRLTVGFGTSCPE